MFYQHELTHKTPMLFLAFIFDITWHIDYGALLLLRHDLSNGVAQLSETYSVGLLANNIHQCIDVLQSEFLFRGVNQLFRCLLILNIALLELEMGPESCVQRGIDWYRVDAQYKSVRFQ